MKKLIKFLGKTALAAGLIPYRFNKDEETGSYEIGGLLWSLKKTAGEENDSYALELLPFLKNIEAAAEASSEDADEDEDED